jgi:hypothetical protein
MSGTEEDTIKFSPELLDEGDTRWDGIRFYNENVSYNYEYLKFTNHTALLFYRADRVSVRRQN